MKKSSKSKKLQNIFVIFANVILCLILFSLFVVYDNTYKDKLYNQNIDDISNINQACANISSEFFLERETKLKDIALYINSNDLDLNECMDYIRKSNSDNSKLFEIIGTDFTGYLIQKGDNGEYIPVSYTNGYSELQKQITKCTQGDEKQEVQFAPEFTDNYTAMRSFALYNVLYIKDELGKRQSYVLMVISKCDDFIERISVESDYSQLATVLINSNGNYIIGNKKFKSDNFYKYLSVFNDLSLYNRNIIQTNVIRTKRGVLKYKNGQGNESVFLYSPVRNRDWFSITEVQVSSFHKTSFEFSYVLMVVGVLLLMMIIDLLYMAGLNRRLRTSAINEKIASVAKTTFLSQMSHEIRTPMNAIIGMTKLAEDTKMSEETREYLVKIENSSKYLLEVLNDILDMSRIESGNFELHREWISANYLISTCLDILRSEMNRKNITFQGPGIDFDKGFEFYVDPLRTKQIIMNLLNNAIKFTPEGGKISLSVEVNYVDDSHRVDTVKVTDTGCGMSKEFLKRIFKPFEQEQNPYSGIVQGTGLGLTLVKKIIDAMGGDIRVESELGKGSSFIYNLPIEYRTEQIRNKEHKDKKDIKINNLRVLLVEDNMINREIAIKLLEKEGVIVDFAKNGKEGVDKFVNSEVGHYQVILMDIRMPIMDGIEATKKIRTLERADSKTIPIVAMTANVFDEETKEMINSGMNAYLAKPIDPYVLYETLDDVSNHC